MRAAEPPGPPAAGRTRSLFPKLALALGVGAGLLLLGELALIAFGSEPSDAILERRVSLAESQGVEFDTRTQLQVFLQMRAEGRDLWPSLAPSAMTRADAEGVLRPVLESGGAPLLPFAPPALRTILNGNESGRFATYASDEHGFNNPRGLWGAEPTDLVAIGDSFVQGFAVGAEAGFVHLLRSRFPRALGLGMKGAGPLTQLGAWIEYGAPRRPRWVLWCYFEGNDLLDLGPELETPLLRSYLRPDFSQGLLGRQAEVDAALMAAIEENLAAAREAGPQPESAPSRPSVGSVLTLRRMRGLVESGLSAPDPPAPEVGAARLGPFRAILTRVRDTCAAEGAQLVFVYLPDWNRFDPASRWTPPAQRSRVLGVVRALGVPSIDLTPAFEAHGDPVALFPFRHWGHYNEAGHRLVAETLLEALESLASVR